MGQHEEAIRRLQGDVGVLHSEVEGVRGDTRKILLTLAQQKGERKTAAKIAAVVGAVGGSATALVLKALAVKLGIHA